LQANFDSYNRLESIAAGLRKSLSFAVHGVLGEVPAAAVFQTRKSHLVVTFLSGIIKSVSAYCDR